MRDDVTGNASEERLEDASTRTFEALTPRRCRQLLEGRDVGRIVWSDDDGLQLRPVTFSWDAAGDAVVFRCAEGSTLAGLASPTAVVFEVDELDHSTRTGWSILIRGRTARSEPSPALRESDPYADPVPWASGDRHVYIRIVPDSITGRELNRRP